MYLLVPMLLGVAMVGWVAGMWTHRRAEHWCPVDGLELTCPQCATAERHALESQKPQS